MTNSAESDQLASSEAPTDLDLHCLLRQGMSGSAREWLRWYFKWQIMNMGELKQGIKESENNVLRRF